MSQPERKRAFSQAFEHPATPAHQTKVPKITTPTPLETEGKENASPPDQNHDTTHASPSPANVYHPPGITPHQPQQATSLPLRGVPLRELAELPSSGGLLRPRMTLGDNEPPVGSGAAGDWESAPFTIWEDEDIVMEKLSLGDAEE